MFIGYLPMLSALPMVFISSVCGLSSPFAFLDVVHLILSFYFTVRDYVKIALW